MDIDQERFIAGHEWIKRNRVEVIRPSEVVAIGSLVMACNQLEAMATGYAADLQEARRLLRAAYLDGLIETHADEARAFLQGRRYQ